MPKTVYRDFKIIHGFRPYAEPRFYFFLVERDGKRVSKHCVWAQRNSRTDSMNKSERAEYFRSIGLGRVFDKIDSSDNRNTLNILREKDSIEIILDGQTQKILFDW